ncbi:NADP-dependent oxidoreductase [Actinoplanes sp. NEAU-A12]|uniref:NADP-dependent oxidoreductase n=1 Tax=Actinoplanes sandaracinus TaxID=3045177 RepID=A0ABT6WYM0_9ACTN|nr:NADP-dependent oxidoreductase [Actinoplanes sandaracinus]MDI6104827.1 NADP-dependent oxidoreductase [Actinoplanes sandaracinus]
MRALVMTDFGTPATVTDMPTPSVTRPDEVLVKVQAATLSRWDLLVLDGQMTEHLEHIFPITLGHDFAGVVVETGAEVTGFTPGDAVIGLFEVSHLHEGAIAEYVVLSTARHLAHRPGTLPPAEAATLPLAGLAAVGAVDAVAVRAGDRVLVVGATGGIGGYAVQLAASQGAHVIATGLPEDEPYLRNLGAAEILDYRTDLTLALSDRYPDGIDSLIDAVTQDPTVFAALTRHVRGGGRVASTVMVADSADLATRGIDTVNVMADLAPHGTLDRLAALAAEGTLRAPALEIFNLTDAPKAIDAMRDNHVRGKYVIRVHGTS